jgi:hypothetical protein
MTLSIRVDSFYTSSIIWELPARDMFDIRTAAATDCIKGGINPFGTTSAAVAKNVVVVSLLDV